MIDFGSFEIVTKSIKQNIKRKVLYIKSNLGNNNLSRTE